MLANRLGRTVRDTLNLIHDLAERGAGMRNLAYAAHLRETGHTVAEIVTKTGITRTTLYRHFPPRPAETVTAEAVSAAESDESDPAPTD